MCQSEIPESYIELKDDAIEAKQGDTVIFYWDENGFFHMVIDDASNE